jgi:hypothetical protein
MKSNIAQNRLVIDLALECLRLRSSGFTNVSTNSDQGTFPYTYATADDPNAGVEYLVGITGRVETKADGNWDPRFNLVRSEDDRKKARALAERMNKTLAFVAVALRESDGSYATFFSQLDTIGFPRSIPMLPQDRARYRQLAPYTPDPRVKDLLAS